MSNLPGNPHHDVADSLKREYGLTADKEALNWPLAEINERLAALAYEQRTANLLKVLELQGRMHDAQQAFNLSAFDVAERLGLGENND